MLRVLLLLGLCFTIPAQAGLFADDDARKQIQQLEARVRVLENAIAQQVKSMLDLQSQIETLNGEIRKLRGLNEEVARGLQDAEKRQKDFYVDLDTRVRHFESAEEAAKETAKEAAKEVAVASVVTPVPVMPADSFDTVPENRAFEAAYGLFRSGKHADAAKAFQEFNKRFPDSVHVPNAYYWLGQSQFALKDYKPAMATFQLYLRDYPDAPKAADALFGIAGCQRGLKQPVAASKTLKQLLDKYPSSEVAAKAKKLLATKK